MNIFQKIILIFSVSLAVESKTAQDIQKFIPEFEEYINYSLKEWVAPGVAVAIVKDGKIIYAKGFGVRQQGESGRVDENTVFQIASCSKAFLAATIGKLVDEGKLKWDDKVIEYIPELVLDDEKITKELTVLDLLTHRTGLKGFSGDTFWNLGFSQSELIQSLRYIPFTKKFREEYSYQNHMFSVASLLVERVTGKTIEKLFEQNFFKPLDMKQASVGIDSLRRKFWQILGRQNIAHPHDVRNGKIYEKPFTDEIYLFSGGSGVNASVTDMAKWIQFQLVGLCVNNQLFLKSDTLAFMRSPKVSVELKADDMQFPGERFSDVSYTIGWFKQKYGVGQNKIEFYSHMGAFNGVRSYVLFSPQENLGLVILSNFGSMRVSLLPEGIRSRFLDMYLNLPKVDWTKKLCDQMSAIRKHNHRYKDVERMQYPVQKQADDYYIGCYENPAYGKVEIVADTAGLFMKYRGRVIRLSHWNGNGFVAKGYEVSSTYSDYDECEVVFDASDMNKAKGVYISLMFEGKDQLFKRCVS